MRGGSLERDKDALALEPRRHLGSTEGLSGAAAPELERRERCLQHGTFKPSFQVLQCSQPIGRNWSANQYKPHYFDTDAYNNVMA